MRTITKIKVIKDFKLELTYDNDKVVIVDLAQRLSASDLYEDLRNEDSFSKVMLTSSGRYIYWENGIEFCVDSLWFLATGEAFEPSNKQAS